MPKEGDLRVWWIPQVPMQAFRVPVKNVDEAILILNTLADYDLFQFNNNIKPDYCNEGGLERFEEKDNDWFEYYDEEGRDIDEIIKDRAEPTTAS
jgi:hypothetical protein